MPVGADPATLAVKSTLSPPADVADDALTTTVVAPAPIVAPVSAAPTSHATPCGRGRPRWSAATPAPLQPPAAGIASMAGLPECGSRVSVGPPLLASGSRLGSTPTMSCAAAVKAPDSITL